MIITSPNSSNFEKSFNKIIQDINEWFKTNLLSLNLDKMHFIQFVTKNSCSADLNIMHENKKIPKVYNTKFLGLMLGNTLSKKTHIDTILPKLSSATFALSVVKQLLSQYSLKMVYYSYFHSVMTYRLIFWGNSHRSNIIFRQQKRIIRIIVGIRGRDSCREHFKKVKILPLQSQYILSLTLFVIDNGNYFKMNSGIHNINTRNKSNLHVPISNLSVYQKGTFYTGIRLFTCLPSQIKYLSHNRNQFKYGLKNFLYFHSLYTLDEYFSYNKI